MKRYKGTIISLIVFALLNAALVVFCNFRGISAIINGESTICALSVLEWAAVLGLLLAGVSTVLYFSKKERSKPVFIVALVTLIQLCLCAVMLLCGFLLG